MAFARFNSVLLEHDFSRFDNDLHLVTLFKVEMFGTLPCDYAFQLVLSDANCDMRHDVSQDHFGNFSLDLVSC